jgi:glycosyltransferase involved in cell wall biosynthesis
MIEPRNIRLSICIATLNRARFIGETLESIIAQLTEGVEIVVLDGASKDDTQQVVEQYATACPSLRYIRQDRNNGVDQDFDHAVELAAGEFCWLMTDDDLLKPGAVRSVLDALRPEVSLVVVNSEVCNADFSELIEESRLPFSEDRTYRSDEIDRLLRETGGYLTFIGAVVIRRSVWLERDRRTYYGSLFIHVGVIFQKPLPGEVRMIAAPLISIRYGNAMWRPREFEIWMFKWPSLIWSMPAPSPAAKAALCAAEPWRDFRKLVMQRANGAYSLREYQRWIAPRVGTFVEGLPARLAALVPGGLANVAALLYYRTVRRASPLSLYDTRSSRHYFRNWLRMSRPTGA